MAEGVTPRLRARGLSRSYGATAALSDVSLDALAGEVHAIVGENGAGKSTLLGILAGATRADAGSMELDGAPYRVETPAEARRAGIATVHQELSLCPHLSVEANVLLGLEPSRFGVLRKREARAKAREALAAVSAESIDLDARAGDLPTAAQQLVEIARAVALPNVRVLVLDEPTSSLGEGEAKDLFALIRRLRDRGVAVLYVSHFLEEVKAIADRYTVLRDGKLVGAGKIADVTIDALVTAMAGRSVGELFPRSPRTPGEVVLSARELAGLRKPQEATFELRRGEVLGLAGLVGAGRTELLRAIFGLDRVRRGELRVGAFVGPASPARRLAQGVGMLSEDRKSEGLALRMSIADNLTLSRLDPIVRDGAQGSAAQGWIERLAIRARDPWQPVGELSGGNQQKVAIARLLHHGVDVLLLDEPTRGIDVGSKAQIYRLVDELAVAGKAVLVVSSQLPELLGIADRIAVMSRGRLGPARAVAGLTEESVLAEATAG